MTLKIDIGGKRFANITRDRQRQALKALCFEVNQGSFTCIVGPSGCGKTTLMNIIGGLERPDSGHILLDNRSVARKRIGYMFQNPRLMPWLSALDNVRLVMDKKTRHQGRAETLLQAMGLADSLHFYANRLSGGMQRRVALARAFVNAPSLLLMDEPFVSLDEPAARKLRLLLLESWNERPTTVLFVTHNLQEALFLADRIIFLSPGPGDIILDYTVSLPRPRLDDAVSKMAQNLLSQYPNLLQGSLAKKTAAPLP